MGLGGGSGVHERPEAVGLEGVERSLDGHGRPTETADGTELEWSPDGELLKLTAPGGAETDFGYDGFGRLVEVISPDGEVGRYRYDAAGRRTAVRLDGGLVRRFVYGGAEFPRARVDADGDVLERYIYASYAHVPDLIVRRDGQRLRLITDTVGSVRAVVDADTGAVVQRLAYDAYGRTTQDTAPGTQPFGFKGALVDPVAQSAGLVWMGLRAYLPSIARFTTPDPADLRAVWNEQDALAGDPINAIDADGRMPTQVTIVNEASDRIDSAVNAAGEAVVDTANTVLDHSGKAGAVAATICITPFVGEAACGPAILTAGAIGVASGLRSVIQGDGGSGGANMLETLMATIAAGTNGALSAAPWPVKYGFGVGSTALTWLEAILHDKESNSHAADLRMLCR